MIHTLVKQVLRFIVQIINIKKNVVTVGMFPQGFSNNPS